MSAQAAEFTKGENVSCPASHKRDAQGPRGSQLAECDWIWETSLLLQEFTSGQLGCILNTVFADTEGSLLGMLMFCVVGLTHSFPCVLEEEAEVHSGPVAGCFS